MAWFKCGGGVNVDFVTAGAGQILSGYVGSDANGEPVNGNIPQKDDSGNVSLGVNESKSYPAGYYPNNHGASQGVAAGSVIDSAGGNITTRGDSGNAHLTSGNTAVSYAAGYYPNAHGAYVQVYNGEWG